LTVNGNCASVAASPAWYLKSISASFNAISDEISGLFLARLINISNESPDGCFMSISFG